MYIHIHTHIFTYLYIFLRRKCPVPPIYTGQSTCIVFCFLYIKLIVYPPMGRTIHCESLQHIMSVKMIPTPQEWSVSCSLSLSSHILCHHVDSSGKHTPIIFSAFLNIISLFIHRYLGTVKTLQKYIEMFYLYKQILFTESATYKLPTMLVNG